MFLAPAGLERIFSPAASNNNSPAYFVESGIDRMHSVIRIRVAGLLAVVVTFSAASWSAWAQPGGFPGLPAKPANGSLAVGSATGLPTVAGTGAAGVPVNLSEIIRSKSDTNMRPSMAGIDNETARSMNYDNQIKQVQTYFEKRRLNKSYREAERAPRKSSYEYAVTAKAMAPSRLSASEYDAVHGKVKWPGALRATSYSGQRAQLDKLFAAHAASGGGIGTAEYADIQSSLTDLQSALKKDFKTTNSDQFLQATNFLKSLRYEARFSVGS
jgi:hypothetical protein